jgi:hypothetical protein
MNLSVCLINLAKLLAYPIAGSWTRWSELTRKVKLRKYEKSFSVIALG